MGQNWAPSWLDAWKPTVTKWLDFPRKWRSCQEKTWPERTRSSPTHHMRCAHESTPHQHNHSKRLPDPGRAVQPDDLWSFKIMSHISGGFGTPNLFRVFLVYHVLEPRQARQDPSVLCLWRMPRWTHMLKMFFQWHLSRQTWVVSWLTLAPEWLKKTHRIIEVSLLKWMLFAIPQESLHRSIIKPPCFLQY